MSTEIGAQQGTDWSLYLVTDPVLGGGPEDVPDIVDAALRGGVTVVQLRDKNADSATFTTRAAELAAVIDQRVPFFVNDRVETAAELGLHLHIGQGDIPYRAARRHLPAHLMIGLSVETPEQLDAIARDIAEGIRPPDVLGIGPVEQTSTKPDAATPIGIPGVRELSARARDLGIPCVAIGGIHPGNTVDLLRAGAAGVCTVSAIMSATDPRSAAAAFRSLIDHTFSKHPGQITSHTLQEFS